MSSKPLKPLVGKRTTDDQGRAVVTTTRTCRRWNTAVSTPAAAEQNNKIPPDFKTAAMTAAVVPSTEAVVPSTKIPTVSAPIIAAVSLMTAEETRNPEATPIATDPGHSPITATVSFAAPKTGLITAAKTEVGCITLDTEIEVALRILTRTSTVDILNPQSDAFAFKYPELNQPIAYPGVRPDTAITWIQWVCCPDGYESYLFVKGTPAAQRSGLKDTPQAKLAMTYVRMVKDELELQNGLLELQHEVRKVMRTVNALTLRVMFKVRDFDPDANYPPTADPEHLISLSNLLMRLRSQLQQSTSEKVPAQCEEDNVTRDRLVLKHCGLLLARVQVVLPIFGPPKPDASTSSKSMRFVMKSLLASPVDLPCQAVPLTHVEETLTVLLFRSEEFLLAQHPIPATSEGNPHSSDGNVASTSSTVASPTIRIRAFRGSASAAPPSPTALRTDDYAHPLDRHSEMRHPLGRCWISGKSRETVGAHIVPRLAQDSLLSAINGGTGVEQWSLFLQPKYGEPWDRDTVNGPRNGLMLWKPLGELFDRFFFTLIPLKTKAEEPNYPCLLMHVDATNDFQGFSDASKNHMDDARSILRKCNHQTIMVPRSVSQRALILHSLMTAQTWTSALAQEINAQWRRSALVLAEMATRRAFLFHQLVPLGPGLTSGTGPLEQNPVEPRQHFLHQLQLLRPECVY